MGAKGKRRRTSKYQPMLPKHHLKFNDFHLFFLIFFLTVVKASDCCVISVFPHYRVSLAMPDSVCNTLSRLYDTNCITCKSLTLAGNLFILLS
jgi:hypothetical protein